MKNKEIQQLSIGMSSLIKINIFILFFRLEDFITIKPLIDDLELPQSSKILNLGCGNAEFSEDLYDDGYQNIINIDIAENVIKYMQERNIKREKMTCKLPNKLQIYNTTYIILQYYLIFKLQLYYYITITITITIIVFS